MKPKMVASDPFSIVLRVIPAIIGKALSIMF